MTESVVLTVTGMKCGGCETNVKNKLLTIEGINTITASAKNNEVVVEFDNEKANLDAIKNAITEAGFTVE